MYILEYQLKGNNTWRRALSAGAYETEAISNFAADYSPSHGIVTAVRVIGQAE